MKGRAVATGKCWGLQPMTWLCERAVPQSSSYQSVNKVEQAYRKLMDGNIWAHCAFSLVNLTSLYFWIRSCQLLFIICQICIKAELEVCRGSLLESTTCFSSGLGGFLDLSQADQSHNLPSGSQCELCAQIILCNHSWNSHSRNSFTCWMLQAFMFTAATSWLSLCAAVLRNTEFLL